MKKRAAFLAAFFCAAFLGLSAQADIVGNSMNFRANPSILGQSIGSVPQGASVTKITSDGEWDYISYNGVTGWIHSGNLTAAPVGVTAAGTAYGTGTAQYAAAGSQYTSTGTQTYTNTSTGAVSQYGVTTPSAITGSETATVLYSMNFRMAPNMSGTIMTTVPAGSVVTRLASENGWDYINYNGTYGWIAGGRLSIGTTASAQTSTTAASQTYTGTNTYTASTGGSRVGAAMNFRAAPGLTGSVLGIIPVGSSVQYQYSSNGWDYVTYNGGSGWIKSGNLY